MIDEQQMKARFIHSLPGRMRVEVFGLQHNEHLAANLISTLQRFKGVLNVKPCTSSGRVLILYEPTNITLEKLCHIIQELEASFFTNEEKVDDAVEQVAATIDDTTEVGSIPAQFTSIPKLKGRALYKPAVPLPLVVSMGGLAVLGIKQLFMGKSALARSPLPFYTAGIFSIITGYPFLRRGIDKLTQQGKINTDFLLGLGALGLGLVRENLVVLGGLSILQFLHWQREERALKEHVLPFDPDLADEIKEYSERTSKLSLLTGGLTWAFTRDPIRALAVLLAANPRPITVAAQYTWKQAELSAQEEDYCLPKHGSVSTLARTKTVLVEDTSVFFNKEDQEIECFIMEEAETDKICCLAASILEKSNHPWKDYLKNRAESSKHTLRKAFRVEEEANGVKGKVNSTWILIGDATYLQENDISLDACALQAKRMQRQGYQVQFIAKKTDTKAECLGFFAQNQGVTEKDTLQQLKERLPTDWYIAVLNNSNAIEHDTLEKAGLNLSWLSLSKLERLERILALKNNQEEVLYIKESEDAPTSMGFNEIPTVTLSELEKLPQTLAYSAHMSHLVKEHFQITKLWNNLGVVLAMPLTLSAPIINLIGDGLTLLFLARTHVESKVPVGKATNRQYAPVEAEIAATMDAHAIAQPFNHGAKEPLSQQSKPYLAWHSLSSQETLKQLGSNMEIGLRSADVLSAREQYGYNQLQAKQPKHWLSAYLSQFKEFTTLMLLGTSLFTFFTGGIFDGLAMGAVLFANAAIGTIQERKAEQVVEALSEYKPTSCKVLRDGEEMSISAIDLVPGDLVSLEAGDKVPADLRIIRAWNLEANEAPLTGESLPISKSPVTMEKKLAIADQRNMLFMGTDITRGKGVGVVVRTGMHTEIGQLMALMKNKEKEVTPLQEKVTSISKTFMKWAFIAGGAVLGAGLLRGIPLTQIITTTTTLIVSAIPEGLPITITFALSAGIYRMMHKNALIRKLSALETLGRTTIICSDKTGTLTKNEMTVKKIQMVEHAWDVSGSGYEPIGELTPLTEAGVTQSTQNHAELDKLLKIGLLCSNSQLVQEDDRWRVNGDPTEGALLTLAAKRNMWKDDWKGWQKVHEIPFDSNSGVMSVICIEESHSGCFTLTKGSIEAVLGKCTYYQVAGNVYELTEPIKEKIFKQNEALAEEALRVIGFAYAPIQWQEGQTDCPDENLIYVGMVGMIDPPHEHVERSIEEALELGIKPVMITGDHPITARAIAGQLGIYSPGDTIMTGMELDQLTDDELSEQVESISVFARVTPEHKLRIVQAYQKKGHIVAMTGDGVNDTPAIKQANVGIAMGRTGTEVTKETADIVLKEDHFGSIMDGVKEGRTIMSNIRKALGCLLTGNLAEIFVSAAAVIVGLPIPLVPIQILLMNLITDALPALILAVNPGSKAKQTKRMDIVDKELYFKVITRGAILGVGSLGLFAYSLASGLSVGVASTMAFATLVAGQLMQTFSWRQEGSNESLEDVASDRFLVTSLGVSWLALLAAIYAPPLARFFHTTPLSMRHWLMVLSVAGSVPFVSNKIGGKLYA